MKYALWAILACLVAACGQQVTNEQVLADAAMLANLQCEAKKLQDERFQLATDIRLLEDSLYMEPDTARAAIYRTKLDKLSSGKEDIALRTKLMADSITHVLDGLYKGIYKDTAGRRLLDVALTAQFEKTCQ